VGGCEGRGGGRRGEGVKEEMLGEGWDFAVDICWTVELLGDSGYVCCLCCYVI